jgi:hypothetical protein
MFDDQKQKIIHQITVPDNTFGIFCHYDQDTKTVSIFVGDFASENVIDTDQHDMLLEIGDSITMMLQSTIDHAIKETIPETPVTLKPLEKIKKVDGNVVYANFNSKRIH